MNEVAIFSDSACDLPAEMIKRHDVSIIPFKFSFDRIKKITDGVDISTNEFYTRLEASGSVPKTYFPTVRDYVDAFKKRLDLGQDVLCICMSSKLSKSYFSALNAKKILSHIYKNNKIMVFDSLAACGVQALLIIDAAKLKLTMDVESICVKLDEVNKNALTIFTVSSLDQLAKGGRLSQSSAFLGNLLGINPIIYLEKGALISKSKARGRQKALDEIKSLAVKEMGGNPKNYDFCTLHTRSFSEAETVAKDMETAYGIRQAIKPMELGMTIGMHTGTTVVAIAFVKKV